MTVELSKRALLKEIKQLKEDLEVSDRLYITADTALRPYMKTASEKTIEALDWELKAKTYRAAFIFIVVALVIAMAVIIALAVYFR